MSQRAVDNEQIFNTECKKLNDMAAYRFKQGKSFSDDEILEQAAKADAAFAALSLHRGEKKRPPQKG